MFVAKCDGCGKEEAARQGQFYKVAFYIVPLGWYVGTGPGVSPLHVHSVECLAPAEAMVPENLRPHIEWKQALVRQKKEPVPPDQCKWCNRLGKLCPAHVNQQAKAERRALIEKAVQSE